MFISHASCLSTTSLTLALALAARGAVLQEAPSLHLDQTDYMLTAACAGGKGGGCSYSFTLVATYRNPTTDTLFVSRCRPRDPIPMYGIEPFPDTTEQAAYDRMWACVGHESPIVIPPHTTRVDTLPIEGPRMWDSTGAPLGKLDGEFRLVYDASRCRKGRPTCPVQLQRSRPFRVHSGP